MLSEAPAFGAQPKHLAFRLVLREPSPRSTS
jgi:hypothetical protein